MKLTQKALNEFAARMKKKHKAVFLVSFVSDFHNNLIFVQTKEAHDIYTIGYYFSLEEAEKVINELYK